VEEDEMRNKTIHMLAALCLVVLAGCKGGTAGSPTGTPAGPAELVVLVHDSFAVSEGVLKTFEDENNIHVSLVKGGDAGALLNRAILTKDSPEADVLYGVDNTFLSRALSADIFQPYVSPQLKSITQEYRLDAENRALPVDYGDVCINVDKAYFIAKGLPVPQSLDDLLKPEYKGLLVVENPATSSPGLAFLLATVAQYGDPGYLDFWKGLRDNGVVVVGDWSTAYYTNFSASSGKGAQPMAVSYGTSPAAEVIFAATPLDEAPTASILGSNTCFRQVEFVGILKAAKNRAAAEKFVDWMLSIAFQEDMTLQMFVYPVNAAAQLPDAFVKYAEQPAAPASIEPSVIASQRDGWIAAWDEVVLR
jgi:thiamine transport system substrate-binding protein